jgi:hypothetical protein
MATSPKRKSPTPASAAAQAKAKQQEEVDEILNKLTDKELLFARIYVKTGVGYRSYMDANPGVTRTSAMSAVTKIRKRPHMAAAISFMQKHPLISGVDDVQIATLQDRLQRRAEIALTTDSLTALERVMVDGVTREGVIKELAKIAFAPTSDQHVRVADKRQALGTLAQIMGMVVEQRHVRVVRSIEDLSEVELKAIVNGAQQKTINGNAVDIT